MYFSDILYSDKNRDYGCISVEFEGIEDSLTALKLGLENVKKFWGMF